MEIQYLKLLKDNPEAYPNDIDYKGAIKPIPMEEIIHLEQLYNNSNPFPVALRELLFIAGESCYVLDYGLDETQEELQEYVREKLIRKGRVINRPFFVIDVYNSGDQFLLVYLDEGDNPAVYEAHYYDHSDWPDWISLVTENLSTYINVLIERVKQGRNPF